MLILPRERNKGLPQIKRGKNIRIFIFSVILVHKNTLLGNQMYHGNNIERVT